MANSGVTVITELSNYPITPDKIDISGVADDYLPGIFGKYESEVAAFSIIKRCQERGDWRSFTLGDLKKVKISKDTRLFIPAGVFWLVFGKFIVHKKRKYYLTEDFIQRCYENFSVET